MTEKKLTINELRAGTKSSRAFRIGVVAVIAAVAAAGVWYFGFADKVKAPTYRTVEITRGPLEVTVVANGTVNPVRTVSIGSELSGIVRKVNVDVNSVVKAGDVLIELDDSNLKANVNQAKASLASAKASLAEAQATLVEAEAKMRRYEELNKSSGGRLPSRTELDVQRATVLKSKAGVQSALAAIDDAQATLDTRLTDLSKSQIKSPVDGVVLTRSVEPGYAVAASLQAVVDDDEADVGQVKEGQDATFTVASYPNKRFPAKLTKVAYGSTTSTDNVITYTAYLDVKNPQLELRPGMTATATINTAKSENALLVPSTALRFKPVVNSDSQKSGVGIMMPPHRSRGTKTAKEVSLAQYQRNQTVYVVDEKGNAKPVEIVTGLTNGRMTEVISGPLQAGDKVITDQLKGMP